MKFTHLFQIFSGVDAFEDWNHYGYLTLMIASTKFYKEHGHFDDQHIYNDLPPNIQKLIGGEIMESTFEFNKVGDETLSECMSRCIQKLTMAGCLYIGNEWELNQTIEESFGLISSASPNNTDDSVDTIDVIS